MNPIVLIPARMASSRLPGKPLALIDGLPMIVQVVRRAEEAAVGPIHVATDCEEIAQVAREAGANVSLTSPDHPSGSDRIHEALMRIDPERRHDIVVNLQGDLPLLSRSAVHAILEPFDDPAVDITTLASVITDPSETTNPNIVKAVASPITENRLRALYFTRATAPSGEGPLYHHVGLYGYRRAALERFVSLPPSPLEKRERLEQLRALEAGMRIDVRLIDDVPFGVDTPADLEKARRLAAARRKD